MVSEGQQALQLLQEQRQQFSLILMDLQLPDVDGDEVYLRYVEHCRQLGLRPLPCVAVTASTSAEARQRAEQAGMQGFLAKPVTRKALQQVLARFDGSESQHQSD
jgi:CheY-like chemotaxis protein